jgi:hypothetical protein
VRTCGPGGLPRIPGWPAVPVRTLRRLATAGVVRSGLGPQAGRRSAAGGGVHRRGRFAGADRRGDQDEGGRRIGDPARLAGCCRAAGLGAGPIDLSGAPAAPPGSRPWHLTATCAGDRDSGQRRCRRRFRSARSAATPGSQPADKHRRGPADACAPYVAPPPLSVTAAGVPPLPDGAATVTSQRQGEHGGDAHCRSMPATAVRREWRLAFPGEPRVTRVGSVAGDDIGAAVVMSSGDGDFGVLYELAVTGIVPGTCHWNR